MTTITLLLEEDEQFALRAMMRQMELMLPDIAEGVEDSMYHTLMEKIIAATSGLSEEWRKEVGKMQRAVRKVKGTQEYTDVLTAMKALTILMMKKIKEEETLTIVEDFKPKLPDNFMEELEKLATDIEMAGCKTEYRLIVAEEPAEFDAKCAQAEDDGFMSIGVGGVQVVMGTENGKCVTKFVQQWVKETFPKLPEPPVNR